MIQTDIIEYLSDPKYTMFAQWPVTMLDDLTSSPCKVKWCITIREITDLVKYQMDGDYPSRKALIEYLKYSKSVNMSWKNEMVRVFNQYYEKNLEANEMLEYLICMLL